MKFYKKQYEIGDKRTRKKFAWFPTRINKHLTVWFERYQVEEELIRYSYIDFDMDERIGRMWKTIRMWEL